MARRLPQDADDPAVIALKGVANARRGMRSDIQETFGMDALPAQAEMDAIETNFVAGLNEISPLSQISNTNLPALPGMSQQNGGIGLPSPTTTPGETLQAAPQPPQEVNPPQENQGLGILPDQAQAQVQSAMENILPDQASSQAQNVLQMLNPFGQQNGDVGINPPQQPGGETLQSGNKTSTRESTSRRVSAPRSSSVEQGQKKERPQPTQSRQKGEAEVRSNTGGDNTQGIYGGPTEASQREEADEPGKDSPY